MQDDNLPISGREISINTRSFFTEEVASMAHSVCRGIESDDNVSEGFCLMISRFDDCTEHIGDDLQQLVVLDADTPTWRLFNLTRFMHSSSLALGRCVENDEIGDEIDCSNFEYARNLLADTEELVDELEVEHGTGDDSSACCQCSNSVLGWRVTMTTSNSRVTARIVNTDNGGTYRESRAGGTAFDSIEALEARLRAC